MKCERCGHELSTLSVDMFAYDGSDSFVDFVFQEEDENVVTVETTQNWTGYGLSEEEMPDTIRCPICGRFPFEDTEIQVYDVIRLVMFRKKALPDFTKSAETLTYSRELFNIQPIKNLHTRIIREICCRGCIEVCPGNENCEKFSHTFKELAEGKNDEEQHTP